MWRWIVMTGLLGACGEDGPSGGEDANLDASVTIACTSDPDAATALGVRGAELWDRFSGVYTLPSNRPIKKGFEAATFTVTIARTEMTSPGLNDCAQVAVPVLVTVQGADPSVNQSIVGVLRGSLLSADVAFATPEYLLGYEPSFYGSLLFTQGQAPQLRLRTDRNGSWYAPPLQVAP